MMNNALIPYLLSSALALEPSAYPKPGNVHRLADLAPRLYYEDFIVTCSIGSKWLVKAFKRGKRGWKKIVFGDLIYGLVRDIHLLLNTNTCLGSSLLLIPLAMGISRSIIHGKRDLKDIIEETMFVVKNTTVYDTIYFYKAVRLASPSYIKKTDNVGEYVNVWSKNYRKELLSKNHSLYQVLVYSSKIDIVSDELVNGYPRSLDAIQFLEGRLYRHKNWNRGVVETYIYLLCNNIDTMVMRTHGLEVAETISGYACKLLDKIDEDHLYDELLELDKMLRRKNINPGSVADIIVSTIALYLYKRVFMDKKKLFRF